MLRTALALKVCQTVFLAQVLLLKGITTCAKIDLAHKTTHTIGDVSIHTTQLLIRDWILHAQVTLR